MPFDARCRDLHGGDRKLRRACADTTGIRATGAAVVIDGVPASGDRHSDAASVATLGVVLGRRTAWRRCRPSRPAAVARLPGEVTTIQYLEAPDRRFQFKATAGAIPLYDAADGSLQAEVAYVAYVKSEGGPTRPVTFVFNGGPGAASAYLQIGAIGPWRLALDQITPSTSPTLVPNAETWLDFTDLVFVDPPGTGYSRLAASGDGPRRHFWSVNGDAQALAVVIRKWIERTGRQVSPKFIVGESYGGFRAPKIARLLQDGQNVGVNGVVLISPVLDFGVRNLASYLPEHWVAYLPSMAATAREAKAGGEAGFDRAALS